MQQNSHVHVTEPVNGAEGVAATRPLGCSLAMRVMQSDLYPTLDDAERADCDELIQQNLDWFKRDNARAVTNPIEADPK